jgi:2-C-methyl-D-erythritol 4-phosphate cytidylyltransferase
VVDFVAVHDAARPFSDVDLLQRGVALLGRWDGAIPGFSITDTIKEAESTGIIVRTVDRSTLRAVQTPQLFRLGALLACHAAAVADGINATDDGALLERYGHRVVVFPGRQGNFKITTPYDLALARLLVAHGEALPCG